MGAININMKKKFLKLWYKKKKITLQDVSLSKKDGPMEASKEVIDSLNLNHRQSLQKEMKKNYKKNIMRKLRRTLTQRHKVL